MGVRVTSRPPTDPPSHAATSAPRTRAGRLIDRVLLTTWRAIVEFLDDRAHRPAAEIAFFAALSSIPLALLLVASFGLVLEGADVRGRVIDTVFEYIPLADDSDRALLERTIAESLAGAGTEVRVGPEGKVGVGLQNHTNFLRPMLESAHVHSTATRRHGGRTTWVWDVDHADDAGRVCAITRVVIAVRPGAPRA